MREKFFAGYVFKRASELPFTKWQGLLLQQASIGGFFKKCLSQEPNNVASARFERAIIALPVRRAGLTATLCRGRSKIKLELVGSVC